ncbi:lytic murein transglycosylase [Roseiarcus fermentans]|uniref:Lytic murein transglycosylase n=1 Tax=Roseiarcus fermentans TaxID=1473586 RepID=A0A366EP22_9HYPH|nr:lytic murein transglycosylase [Roseiarcus fermentans]RBP04167.1 lytic murein transglycosylase [Roseiarcus fermentans]
MAGRIKKLLAAAAVAGSVLAAPAARAEDCGKGPDGFHEWLAGFRQIAARDGVSEASFEAALGGVSYDTSVGAHDRGVVMLGHNFEAFAAAHVTPGIVSRGKALLAKNAATLSAIEQRFGVPGAILVAIWGLETSFGGDNGSYPTFAALATLAWDCRRADRFRAELIDALTLVEKGVWPNPKSLRGAWAGEIGQTQLMPSAIMMFATTPDGAGTADVVHNSGDALASTAAFLAAHGWQRGAGWNEGEPNFPAILQWNASPVYAKTIALFGDRLAGR